MIPRCALATRAMVLAAAVMLAALGVACRGTSEQTRFRESLPAFEDVEMVAIGTYPYSETAPLPLTPDDNGERIGWIVEQLRRAPISAAPVDDDGMRIVGHVAASFRLAKTDGTEAAIVWAAADCYPQPGGHICRLSPRDVVVTRGNTAVRLAAPALAQWQREGWQEEVRIVSQSEYETFMEQRFPVVRIPDQAPQRLWVMTHPSDAAVPQPLVASNPGDALAISKVLDWIRQASAGSPQTEQGDAQRFDSTDGVMFAFPGDIGFRVAPAYICISDGTNEPCYRTPDEVLVEDFRGFRGPYHLQSPELAGWLASGYLADMRMGTYEEYQREAHW